MVNITLSIPMELHEIIKKHNEIKWSEIARRAMWDEAKKLQWMEKVLEKSRFTEEDAERIGNKIKHEIARKYGLVK